MPRLTEETNKKQGRSIIIHYQISLLFWKSAILKRRRWIKKDIITKNSHSLCYFTPSKKQGRRNFWANGLIGPSYILSLPEKMEKTDQMWLFYDWPKKVTCIPTPLQRWNKKCLAYYLIYEINNNVAKAFLKIAFEF